VKIVVSWSWRYNPEYSFETRTNKVESYDTKVNQLSAEMRIQIIGGGDKTLAGGGEVGSEGGSDYPEGSQMTMEWSAS
jgi:hypothetical protein